MTDADLAAAIAERAVMARLVAVGLQNHVAEDDPSVRRQFGLARSLEQAAMDLHQYSKGA